MTKDYYQILGVTEFDSPDTVKSAYRKLARKWHPDVAGDSEDVIVKFKDINEAYEVLSNTEKRTEYDRMRRFYNYAHSNPSQKKEEENKTDFKQTEKSFKQKFEFKWEDFILRKKSAESFQKDYETLAKKGKDIYSDLEITVIEAIDGCTKIVNMLQTQVCPKCGGRKFVNGGICKHCNGKGEQTTYKKFTVKIPAGIKNNSKIRLAGEGETGINGGQNGDLYLTIHIQASYNYKTEGLNILKNISITPFEAVLGTNVKIDTPRGDVSFNIRPQTQSGQKIKLANCGLVQNNQIGDMIVTVEIKIPTEITDDEIALYRRLEELSKNKCRDNYHE